MAKDREHFSERAREARRLADTVAPSLRGEFLRIAEDWEMLVRHQDDRAQLARFGLQ